MLNELKANVLCLNKQTWKVGQMGPESVLIYLLMSIIRWQ